MGGKSTFPVNHGRQTGDTATGTPRTSPNIPGNIFSNGSDQGRSSALELAGQEGYD